MLQHIIRPVRVFLTLLPYIVSFLRDWQGYVFFGEPRKLNEQQHRDRAHRLTRTLADLGPAFIKGAQVLATREDILPKTYTDELKTLQDRVPPFPSKEALSTIEEALGRPAKEIFDSFDRTPIAAASLGQVHKAVYKGTPVAVKILRPRVTELVEIDLSVVGFIIRLFDFFIDSHFIRSFWAIHQEYTRVIREEMNFRNEERNAARLRKNFAKDPRIVIPFCHTELTSSRTAVFDFVEGVRVDDPDALRANGLPPAELVNLLIETYVRMTIVHGFVHSDPHPGNLLVDRQGRVVLLDYGMALEFSDSLRLELLRACLAVVRGDLDTVVDSFYRLDMVDPEINRSLVRDAAETLLQIQLREDFTPRLIQEIADDILQTFHRFPLRMPQQLVYLFRASALIEGLGMKYDEYFSGVREATPIIKNLIKEVALEPDKSLKDRLTGAGDTAMRMVLYLQRIVERLEREEQRVRIHQGDMQEFHQTLSAAVRRLLIGLATLAWGLSSLFIFLKTGSWILLLLFGFPALMCFLLCLAIPLRRGRRLKGPGIF